MVNGLREQGHKVFLGNLNEHGNLVWYDGNKTIFEHSGPGESQYLGGIRKYLSLGQYRRFIDEVSDFVRSHGPDVVQFVPETTRLASYLSLSLPKDVLVIQDLKQINLGVDNSLKSVVSDWRMTNGIRLRARYLCDHTLFDYQYAAEAILGENWQAISSVVPLGLDPTFLAVSRPEEPLAGRLDPIRFVYIGIISRFRELETLLYACKELTQETRDFHVDLIGPDRTEGYFKNLINDLDLTDTVEIKDSVPHNNIPHILSSDYEVGLAYNPIRPTWHYQPTGKMLEYYAVGMPIISSDVMSHRDYVEHEVNGLLVPNNPESWAQAMMRFVQDRSFFHRCYQNALERRSANTVADVVRMQEKVYLDLEKKR